MTTKYQKGIVVFGSHVLGLIPEHEYGMRIYNKTESLIKKLCREDPEITVITGGGPGLMEAANKAAKESGVQSLGFPIRGLIDTVVSGQEEKPNDYLDNSFICDTFEERKQHIMYSGTVYLVLPGGYGTLDELFEILTLVQTKKREDVHRIVLIDEQGEFWPRVFNLPALVEAGTIDHESAQLVKYSQFWLMTDEPAELFN